MIHQPPTELDGLELCEVGQYVFTRLLEDKNPQQRGSWVQKLL